MDTSYGPRLSYPHSNPPMIGTLPPTHPLPCVTVQETEAWDGSQEPEGPVRGCWTALQRAARGSCAPPPGEVRHLAAAHSTSPSVHTCGAGFYYKVSLPSPTPIPIAALHQVLPTSLFPWKPYSDSGLRDLL